MHLVAKSPEDLLSSFDKQYTDEENEAYDTIINNIKDPNELSHILQEISLNNTISSRQSSNRRGYKQNQSINKKGKQNQSINKKKRNNTNNTKPKQQQYDNDKEDTTLSNENYFMKQIRLIYEAAGSKIEFDNIDLEIVIAIVDHFTESSQTTKDTKDNTTAKDIIDDADDGIDTDEESLDAIEFSCNALSGSDGGSIVYALNNVMLGVTKAIFPASDTWGEDC